MKKQDLLNIIQEEIEHALHEADRLWMGDVPELDDFGDTIKDEFIDGRTHQGPWAMMSKNSFRQFGVGVGQGKGQWYKKEGDGNWKKIKG